MKDRIKALLGVSLLTPVFAVGVVLAQEDTTTTTETQTTIKVEDTSDPVKLKARLEKRKTDLKTKLTNAQKTRVTAKCKAAQGLVSTANKRTQGVGANRGVVYADMVERLTNLAAKLKAKGLDTAELEGQITELKAKIATFTTDLTAHQQAGADLAAMDCASDPTAFQASLDDARAARAKVVADAAAIKTYVKDTIKPTLATLRAQLDKTGEGEQ